MPIHYLILALTLRCNAKCKYCYNGAPADEEDMSEAVMAQAISLAASDEAPFHLQLTGGEPTLAPTLIERAAVLATESGRCSSIGIQTNATALTPQLLKCFKAFKIQVGISLDGPPLIHQQQRGRVGETLRGLRLLEKNSIPFRVTTVVTQTNAAVLDQLVLTLAGFSNARGIGLDLLVNKGCAKNSDEIVPAKKRTLVEGLSRMAATLDAVNSHRTVPIQFRERDRLITAGPDEHTDFCHACKGESMAVQPDGRIFPCGQTLGDPRFNAGTVWAPCNKTLKALSIGTSTLLRCRQCTLKARCPGDCPSRLYYNRFQNYKQCCDLYKTLWKIEKNSPVIMQGGFYP